MSEFDLRNLIAKIKRLEDRIKQLEKALQLTGRKL